MLRSLERKLFTALRKDDVATVSSLVGSSFCLNHRISPFAAGRHWALRTSPPLIGVAAFFASSRCFRHLLLCGADLSLCDCVSTTVATFAVNGGALSILHLLDAYDASFAGTLFTAAAKGDFRVFMWIFATQEGDITEKKADGTTLLRAAAKGGNWRLIHWLIANMRGHISVTDICEVALSIGDTRNEEEDGATESDDDDW